MKRAVIGAAVFLAVAAPAQAAFVPLPDPFPQVVYGACPGYTADEVAGCVESVTLGGAPLVHLAERSRSVRLHELGHVFDYQHLTDRLRHRFARLMGYRWRPWEQETEWGPSSLAERFAVAYQVCAMHRQVPGWRHGYVTSYAPGFYDYEVSERQHLRVCALIRSATLPSASAVERPVEGSAADAPYVPGTVSQQGR